MAEHPYGGPLISLDGAIDLHCHPYPDLFPRLADDVDIAVAARDAGLKALVLKCHHESTVSRAYLVQRIVPGIRVLGGVVLNSYVGGVNPAAVEAALRLGGKEVWMPTVDAGYHAQVHGGTGGYDAQGGGRVEAEGIWVTEADGKLKPVVKEVLALIAEHRAILGTCHLSPAEIVAAISRVGASRCLLVSDTGQRHNPMPSEALRVFAQIVFEKGVSEADVVTMTSRNPHDLLELDGSDARPRPVDLVWAARLNADPCQQPAPSQSAVSHNH